MNRAYAEAEHANACLSTSSECPLGILPHQIRGSFPQFSQITLVGYCSKSCTACSEIVSIASGSLFTLFTNNGLVSFLEFKILMNGTQMQVVSEYKNRGVEFVLQAINHPTYLEDLTGLTELMKSAYAFDLDWDNTSDTMGDEDDCVEI